MIITLIAVLHINFAAMSSIMFCIAANIHVSRIFKSLQYYRKSYDKTHKFALFVWYLVCIRGGGAKRSSLLRCFGQFFSYVMFL